MTYLTSAEVRLIVHYAGSHIRRFLGNSDLEKFSGEAQKAIKAFHQDPGDFSDESLLEKGANVDDAHRYTVRVELRGINPRGAAQVVAKGIWGPARNKVVTVLRKELKSNRYPVFVRTAGSSSFEFNRAGVDKSLPIRYLRARWQKVEDGAFWASRAEV